MDFGEVLTRAWNVVWKNKILWLFGVLASCGGQTSSSGSNYDFSGGGGGAPPPEDFPQMPQAWRDFFEGFSELAPYIIIALILVGLVLAVVFFLLGVYGRVGLIKGAMQADQGAATLTLGGLHADIMPYFGRAVGLNLLIFAVALAIGLVFAAIFFGITLLTFGIGALCIVPLVCLLIPVAIFAGIVIEQANVALVVDDLGVTAALNRGWEVVRANLGNVIVMALILIVGGAIASFVIALPIALVVFPAAAGIFAGAATESEGFVYGGLGVAAVCLVLLLPVVIVLGGILQAYIESAWTLTYLRLTAGMPKAVAKTA